MGLRSRRHARGVPSSAEVNACREPWKDSKGSGSGQFAGGDASRYRYATLMLGKGTRPKSSTTSRRGTRLSSVRHMCSSTYGVCWLAKRPGWADSLAKHAMDCGQAARRMGRLPVRSARHHRPEGGSDSDRDPSGRRPPAGSGRRSRQGRGTPQGGIAHNGLRTPQRLVSTKPFTSLAISNPHCGYAGYTRRDARRAGSVRPAQPNSQQPLNRRRRRETISEAFREYARVGAQSRVLQAGVRALQDDGGVHDEKSLLEQGSRAETAGGLVDLLVFGRTDARFVLRRDCDALSRA